MEEELRIRISSKLKKELEAKAKELNISLPEINLAIEYNGEYWHSISQSNANRDDKSYRCLLKGITLIHIEEVDWRTNKKYIMHNLKNLILE